MSTSSPAPERSGQRLLLATIAIGTTLAPLNSTMIAVALPDIQRAFDASVTATAWLVTIYLIAMAVGLPVGGRLGDQLGRRPVFLTGLVTFAVASVGCAFAPSLVWLTLFRLLQALSGTLLFPNGSAMIREAVPPGRRGLAFGMIGLAVAVAAASGPPLGGVLVSLFGWHSIFWANVPLIGTALVLGWRALPRGRNREALVWRFDAPGIVLFAIALTSLILVPTLLTHDWRGYAVVAALAGLTAGWGFVRWEGQADTPLVDLSLFSRTHFAAACASILLANTVMYTTLLAIPLYLDAVRGESVRTTGLMLAAMSTCAALMTPLGGRWMDRHGGWKPAVTGATLILAGAVLVAIAIQATGNLLVVAALAVLGVGIGVASAPVQTTAVESVPSESVGAASGIYSTSRYTGNVIGSSVIAMVFVSQPDGGDAGHFVMLFAGLALVALLGVFAHARTADRRIGAPHPSGLRAQENR